MAQESRDVLKKKIKEWLGEEKIFKIEEEFSNEKNDFILKIRLGTTNTIVQVLCPKPYKDRILVAWGVTWLEDDLKSFMILHPETKAKILDNIRRAGVYMNVSFSFIPNFERLKTMMCSKIIYFDGLSKDRLIDVIYSIALSNGFVGEEFKRSNVSYKPFDPSEHI